MKVLQDETPESLAKSGLCSLPSARRLLGAVLQRNIIDLDAELPRNVPRKEARAVAEQYKVGRLRLLAEEASEVDPFVKSVFETADGHSIESVRIPLKAEGRFIVCVSSQVGCALGCTYCATGRLGLTRNLAAWEIVEQVRSLRERLPKSGQIVGIVFQGMGEPMANIDRVIRAIAILCEPSGLAIDQRRITVSTVGLPRGIDKLRESGFRVRLGLSVGSALGGEKRSALLPIEGQFPLETVLASASSYAQTHGDAVMLASTLIAGENTSEEHAHALGRLALRLQEMSAVTPRISLVEYNPDGPDDPRRGPSPEELRLYREAVGSYGIPVKRRYSGGGDVGGACGQLVGKISQP